MHVLVVEEFAAFDEQIEYANVNLFVRPLALAEESGVFIGFAHNIDLGLGLGLRIVAPPASERAKFYGSVAREKLLPKVLVDNSVAHIFSLVKYDLVIRD